MKKKLNAGLRFVLRFQIDEDLIEPINAPELSKQKEAFLAKAQRWSEMELSQEFDELVVQFAAEVKKIRPYLIDRMRPKSREPKEH